MSTPEERYTPGASSSNADVEFCECCNEIFCPCCRRALVMKCCKQTICLFCIIDNDKKCPVCKPPPLDGKKV